MFMYMIPVLAFLPQDIENYPKWNGKNFKSIKQLMYSMLLLEIRWLVNQTTHDVINIAEY